MVKLLQLLKLKKNAQKQTADFLARLLNSEGDVPAGVSQLFDSLKENSIAVNDKEAFVLGN